VLEASAYRPTAICYLPAYLNFSPDTHDTNNTPQTLKNLYYIRFPGCDVPHYYFWTKKGEWDDPTTRNPEWRWDPENVKSRKFVSGKRLPRANSTRGDVQVLREGELEALYRRGSTPGILMGEKCEVGSLASRQELVDDCEEKGLPNEINLMCPFCLKELEELAVEVCC
jgi:hypothetical protein